MSWREDAFFKDTHAIRLFLGEGVGDLGVLVVASADDLNILADAAVDGYIEIDIKGDIVSEDGTVVFEHGTDGTDALAIADLRGDVLSANGLTVLDNGTDGTDAFLTADVLAEDGSPVVLSGPDQETSEIAAGIIQIMGAGYFVGNILGSVLAADENPVVTIGADIANSSVEAGTITAGVGGFNGDLSGNVTGDVSGDVTGDITGNVLAGDAAAIVSSGADIENSSVEAGTITAGTGGFNGNLAGIHNGDVIADDAAAIITAGADIANSSVNAGTITAGAGGFNGDLTGDVDGDVSGDLTGDVLADDASAIVSSGATQAASGVNVGKVTTPEIETAGDLTIDCGANQTAVLEESVWDDLRIVPGAFDFAGSSDPTLTGWQPGGAGATFQVYEFNIDDEVFASCQMPHSYREGTDLNFHIHWTPKDRGVTESGKSVGWKVDYSIANPNGVFGASATVDLQDVCSGVNHQHELTSSVVVDGTGLTISHIIMLRIYRSDTGADDTWANNGAGERPVLLEFDIHYESDTIGSRQEVVK